MKYTPGTNVKRDKNMIDFDIECSDGSHAKYFASLTSNHMSIPNFGLIILKVGRIPRKCLMRKNKNIRKKE